MVAVATLAAASDRLATPLVPTLHAGLTGMPRGTPEIRRVWMQDHSIESDPAPDVGNRASAA